jgi:DNA-binding IclR family transcriptional regulator
VGANVRCMVSGAHRGSPEPAERAWTFLTNHAHVLLSLAQDPDMRLREIASRVGITERATQFIVADLERAGYVTKERIGRRNRYTLVRGMHFRHSAEAGHSVDALMQIFSGPPDSPSS